jgi:glucoamylase
MDVVVIHSIPIDDAGPALRMAAALSARLRLVVVRPLAALALAAALVSAPVGPAFADFVTTITDPTTGEIITTDSATGASTTTDPSAGASTNTTTDPTTGAITTTTIDPTSGMITTTTSDPTTGMITTTTSDPTTGALTTTSANLATGGITTTSTVLTATTSTDPDTGAITTTSTDPTTGVVTTTTSDPTSETVTTTTTDPTTGGVTTTATGLDPLHGYCSSGSCIDNGTNSPTLQNPITGFGFTVSPGPKTGDFVVDILTPSNESHPILYKITGSSTGTATLFSSTPWASGTLANYLGDKGASPNNPIGAYLPSTNNFDPTATGFFVYQANLGTLTLQPASHPNVSPLLNLTQNLQLGSYIVGFLNTSTNLSKPAWIATANSGAIFEGPEIDAASGTTAIALLLGVLLLTSERRRWQAPQIGRD